MTREGFEHVTVSTVTKRIMFPSVLDYVGSNWWQRQWPASWATAMRSNARASYRPLLLTLDRCSIRKCCAMVACRFRKRRMSQ
jgi:hypothetical protein